MDSNPLTCTNCQAVTTNDGRTVWVCENCGNENPVAKNEPQAPDDAAAQAAISDAVAAAGVPPVVTPATTGGMHTIPSVPPTDVPTPPGKPAPSPITDSSV